MRSPCSSSGVTSSPDSVPCSSPPVSLGRYVYISHVNQFLDAIVGVKQHSEPYRGSEMVHGSHCRSYVGFRSHSGENSLKFWAEEKGLIHFSDRTMLTLHHSNCLNYTLLYIFKNLRNFKIRKKHCKPGNMKSLLSAPYFQCFSSLCS